MAKVMIWTKYGISFEKLMKMERKLNTKLKLDKSIVNNSCPSASSTKINIEKCF